MVSGEDTVCELFVGNTLDVTATFTGLFIVDSSAYPVYIATARAMEN